MTRTVGSTIAVSMWLQRYLHGDPGAATLARADLEDTVEHLDALPHARQTEAGPPGRPGAGGADPAAVILDLDEQHAGVEREPDRGLRRSSVLARIGQRLLDHPEDGQFDALVERPLLAIDRQRDLEAICRHGLPGEAAQRGAQAQVFQDPRAQR